MQRTEDYDYFTYSLGIDIDNLKFLQNHFCNAVMFGDAEILDMWSCLVML